MVGPFCNIYLRRIVGKHYTKQNVDMCKTNLDKYFNEVLFMTYVWLTRIVMENHIIGLESFEARISDDRDEIRREIDKLFLKEWTEMIIHKVNINLEEFKVGILPLCLWQ